MSTTTHRAPLIQEKASIIWFAGSLTSRAEGAVTRRSTRAGAAGSPEMDMGWFAWAPGREAIGATSLRLSLPDQSYLPQREALPARLSLLPIALAFDEEEGNLLDASSQHLLARRYADSDGQATVERGGEKKKKKRGVSSMAAHAW